MIGPRTLCLLALCTAMLVIGTAPAAAADPDDGQFSSRAASLSFLNTLPFGLGFDLSTIGVPDSAFATVGPASVAASSGDGPNMYIVDNDLAQCPNAAYTSIQAAVEDSGPGDQIRVCPGLYQEQVDIGAGHDGLTVFSQQPLQAIIKAPQPVMAEPGDIVRIHEGVQDVTIRHFTITGPLPDSAFCSVQTRTGVKVEQMASATIKANHITEIRSTSPALRGCQNGIGIRVGRRFEPGGPQAGSAWITHNRIDKYQKGGIVIDGANSSATIDHNEIVHGPPDVIPIAPNGIQVSRNAAADVGHNIVTENNGADLGTGILLYREVDDPPRASSDQRPPQQGVPERRRDRALQHPRCVDLEQPVVRADGLGRDLRGLRFGGEHDRPQRRVPELRARLPRRLGRSRHRRDRELLDPRQG